MRKRIFFSLIIIVISVFFALGLTACSHLGRIDSSLDKLNKNNYTLEIHSELLSGTVDSVRKYDGDKIYLNYDGEQELFFDKVGERYVDRYIKRGDKWVSERIRSTEINFDVADNFAYAVLKLALSERDAKFTSDKKGYALKDEAFKEVFGDVAGNSAKIIRKDGATEIIAEYNNGKTDTVRIINIGSTKIKLPSVGE